jgi:hypothetical protein
MGTKSFGPAFLLLLLKGGAGGASAFVSAIG